MVDLYEVLFEVSSDTRRRMLASLMGGPATVTAVAGQQRLSLTEASRHFGRLSQAGLVAKSPTGDYSLTLFARTLLSQMEPLEFTVRHSDYFKSHDATRIPSGLLKRISELAEAHPTYRLRANIMRVSERVADAAFEPEAEYMGLLDEGTMELILYAPPGRDAPVKEKTTWEALRRGVRYRVLFPAALDSGRMPAESLEAFAALHGTGLFECRVVPRVDVFIHMNERRVSILSFPDGEGRFDYLGFEASDPASLGWCRDLFEHYWRLSKPFPL